jgi:hypothetical protein
MRAVIGIVLALAASTATAIRFADGDVCEVKYTASVRCADDTSQTCRVVFMECDGPAGPKLCVTIEAKDYTRHECNPPPKE